MKRMRVWSVFGASVLLAGAIVWRGHSAVALEKPDITFKIFQFPADKIPRIDGKADDWDIVPDDYAIGMDQMKNDGAPNAKPDPKNLDVKIKVGWVKGLNRLYFLYEAYDNYWDFGQPDLHNDTFEIIVDGDRSGGPLIADRRLDKSQDVTEAYFSMQGVHAQNYHIFTPAQGKDWCMAWGPQAAWIKKLPYSNIAYNYNFKPGEAGRLTMEFWITPFDYAGAEGPPRAVESELTESKIIGLCWAIMDYDDATKPAHTFWNLSPKHTMFGDASELVGFKLMPLEKQFKKEIDANWSFKIVDMDRRLVAFKDESEGKITSWKWDFGDGTTSTEQNPIHVYEKSGQRYVVVLNVEGPAGKARWSRVWDIALK